MNDRRQGWSRESVWSSVGRCPSGLEKRKGRDGRGRVENVAELWKMTIEFRDWSVGRSFDRSGEEEDAVFMRIRPPIHDRGIR